MTVDAAWLQSDEMLHSVRARQPTSCPRIEPQALKCRKPLQGGMPESSQVGIAVVCVRTGTTVSSCRPDMLAAPGSVPRIDRKLDSMHNSSMTGGGGGGGLSSLQQIVKMQVKIHCCHISSCAAASRTIRASACSWL